MKRILKRLFEGFISLIACFFQVASLLFERKDGDESEDIEEYCGKEE